MNGKIYHPLIRWNGEASVSCNVKVILFINHIKKGKTITGEYYISHLNKLKTAIAEKRLEMAKKKVLFPHNNAPVYSKTHRSLKIDQCLRIVIKGVWSL